jgi:hypothetical protein
MPGTPVVLVIEDFARDVPAGVLRDIWLALSLL